MYAINVVSQMATANDWGTEEIGNGFYEDGITEDALGLLQQAVKYHTIISQLSKIEPQSNDTAYIDGSEWYVIDKKVHNGREMVKIFMADTGIIPNTPFNPAAEQNAWANSQIRNTVLPAWLAGTEILKNVIVHNHPDAGLSTYVPALTPSTTGENSVDSIFLLSEKEWNDLLTLEQRKSSDNWFLRTPVTISGRKVMVLGFTNGILASTGGTTSYAHGVRAAMWVAID